MAGIITIAISLLLAGLVLIAGGLYSRTQDSEHYRYILGAGIASLLAGASLILLFMAAF